MSYAFMLQLAFEHHVMNIMATFSKCTVLACLRRNPQQ